MPTDRMFDLYWLGYLLTGDRERSVQAVIETLEMADAGNPFFENWMVTWSRKIFIAKVLGYVTATTGASELRSRLRDLQSEMGRGLNRGIDPAAGKPELERALLAIEQLPRCALLLNVFEKLAIEDIGILLNVDRESVKTATAIGLIELTRNLAGSGESRTIFAVEDASCGAAIDTRSLRGRSLMAACRRWARTELFQFHWKILQRACTAFKGYTAADLWMGAAAVQEGRK